MTAPPGRARFALLWMAPPLLVLAATLLPVILGRETFFLRDVFSVHLEMRGAAAAALDDGRVPWIDPFRGGGQTLAANPNAVALHPDVLLHRALPFFAAFNAHLWLHLLLAPLALFWLASELGLERRAAWAAGVVWGLSGFLLSQLAFYNLIGGVVTTPALAAAAVRCTRRRAEGRRAWGSAVATALLCALLLLSGDPLTALLGLLATAGLVLAEPLLREAPETRLRAVVVPAVALAAGLFLALPQIAAFVTQLGASARAAGYGAAMRTAGSFDPRQAVEWLLPMAFGLPDRLASGTFWGYRFHQGSWAFYFTLYPGLAALALLAAGGRSWRLAAGAGVTARRGWALCAAGLFVALGAFNPLMTALLALPGLDAARYPMKAWLWVALGASLLCGAGFGRLLDEPPARRRFAGALLLLAVLFAALWLWLRLLPDAAVAALHAAMPPGTPLELAAAERLRWAVLAALSGAAALLLAATAPLLARRRAAGGPLLLTLHAALQIALLRPVLATEPVALYRETPPMLAALPADELVVHGGEGALFGPDPLDEGALPAPEVRWLFRRAHAELYPYFAPLWGRRYDLNLSPEGLDTAGLETAVAAVRGAPDDLTRVRLLAAWGVGRLVLGRALELPAETADLAEEVARQPSFGRPLRVYRLPTAAPAVHLATGVLRLPPEAPPGREASILADRRFRPGRDVVLRAAGRSTLGGGPGTVRVQEMGPRRLLAETAAADPGVLVWQRARLPGARATLDGAPVPVVDADLYRVGVEVPAGRHVVTIDMGPRWRPPG